MPLQDARLRTFGGSWPDGAECGSDLLSKCESRPNRRCKTGRREERSEAFLAARPFTSRPVKCPLQDVGPIFSSEPNPNRENEPTQRRRSGIFPRWTNVAEGYNRTTNVDWCSAFCWGSLDEAYRGPQSFGMAVEIAFLRRARGLHLHQPSEDGAAGFQIRFRHMAMGTLPPISDQLVGSITPNLRSCPFEGRYSVISVG
jgi:hypothetical protein